MNPRIQKLRGELEKNTEKISKLQTRNTELKQQIQELENLDIIGMVRESGLTPEMLAGMLAGIQPASVSHFEKQEEENQ